MLAPTVVTYNTLINVCDKGHQWSQSLGLFAEVHRRSLQASAVTYNSTMAACERALPWADVLELFVGMQRACLNPDDSSYVAMIGTASNQHAWELTIKLLSKARDSAFACTASMTTGVVTACARGFAWAHS